jgi:glutathione synthase
VRILIVMDPPERINVNTDTTLVIIREANRRGHTIALGHPSDLTLEGPALFARAVSVDGFNPDGSIRCGEARRGPVSEFDLVLMRKDPPFDLDYYFATLLLDRSPRG